MSKDKDILGVKFSLIGTGEAMQNVFDSNNVASQDALNAHFLIDVDEKWNLGSSSPTRGTNLAKYIKDQNRKEDWFKDEAVRLNKAGDSKNGAVMEANLADGKHAGINLGGVGKLPVKKVLCVKFPSASEIKFSKSSEEVAKKIREVGGNFYKEIKRLKANGTDIQNLVIPDIFGLNRLAAANVASLPLWFMEGLLSEMQNDSSPILQNIYFCDKAYMAILDQALVVAKAALILKQDFKARRAEVDGSLASGQEEFSDPKGYTEQVSVPGKLRADELSNLSNLLGKKAAANSLPNTSADGLPPPPLDKAGITAALKAKINLAINERYQPYLAQQNKDAQKEDISKFTNNKTLVIFTNGSFYKQGTPNLGMDPDAVAAACILYLKEVKGDHVGRNIFIFDNQSGNHWEFDRHKIEAGGALEKQEHHTVSGRGSACASFAIIGLIAADPTLSKLCSIQEVLNMKNGTKPMFTEKEKEVINGAFGKKKGSVTDAALARKFVASCAFKAMREQEVAKDTRNRIFRDIVESDNYTESEGMGYALQGLGVQYSLPSELHAHDGGGVDDVSNYLRSVYGDQKGKDNFIAEVISAANITDAERVEAKEMMGSIDQLVENLTGRKAPEKAPVAPADYLVQAGREAEEDLAKEAARTPPKKNPDPDLVGPALVRTGVTNTLDQALLLQNPAPVVPVAAKHPAKKPTTPREKYLAKAKSDLAAQRAAKTLIKYEITHDLSGIILTYEHYENGETKTTSEMIKPDEKIIKIARGKIEIDTKVINNALMAYYKNTRPANNSNPRDNNANLPPETYSQYAERVSADNNVITPFTTIQAASAIQAFQRNKAIRDSGNNRQ